MQNKLMIFLSSIKNKMLISQEKAFYYEQRLLKSGKIYKIDDLGFEFLRIIIENRQKISIFPANV